MRNAEKIHFLRKNPGVRDSRKIPSQSHLWSTLHVKVSLKSICRKCVLGALLPGARYPAGRDDGGQSLSGTVRRLLQHFLLRDGIGKTRPALHFRRPRTYRRRRNSQWNLQPRCQQFFAVFHGYL